MKLSANHVQHSSANGKSYRRFWQVMEIFISPLQIHKKLLISFLSPFSSSSFPFFLYTISLHHICYPQEKGKWRTTHRSRRDYQAQNIWWRNVEVLNVTPCQKKTHQKAKLLNSNNYSRSGLGQEGEWQSPQPAKNHPRAQHCSMPSRNSLGTLSPESPNGPGVCPKENESSQCSDRGWKSVFQHGGEKPQRPEIPKSDLSSA